MIQGADREHPQDLVGSYQRRRHRADRSVSARCHHNRFVALRGLARYRCDVVTIVRMNDARFFNLHPEQLDNACLRIVRPARAAIHDHDHRNGIVSTRFADSSAPSEKSKIESDRFFPFI
jgi:hypothetical protein